MKSYAILNSDKEYEYDLTVEDTDAGTKYTLLRSNKSEWTNPEEEIISAVDTGNGIKLNQKVGSKLDYSDLIEVSIVLNAIRKFDNNLAPDYLIVDVDSGSRV